MCTHCLTQRATWPIIVHGSFLHRSKVIEQLLNVRIWNSIVQIADYQTCWPCTVASTTISFWTIVHIMFPSAVYITLKGGLGRRFVGWFERNAWGEVSDQICGRCSSSSSSCCILATSRGRHRSNAETLNMHECTLIDCHFLLGLASVKKY